MPQQAQHHSTEVPTAFLHVFAAGSKPRAHVAIQPEPPGPSCAQRLPDRALLSHFQPYSLPAEAAGTMAPRCGAEQSPVTLTCRMWIAASSELPSLPCCSDDDVLRILVSTDNHLVRRWGLGSCRRQQASGGRLPAVAFHLAAVHQQPHVPPLPVPTHPPNQFLSLTPAAIHNQPMPVFHPVGCVGEGRDPQGRLLCRL